ncbi:hypothetical protein [Nesterenkonia natronophila]|uniref:Uncharacterized protein n=1 Tax=Nesterenkonia natronophila TaxID=2174932 RepID=A0A3A4F1Y8_9MICC|nr:hypothetical protein [Nesterenkonia natronophila]RJN31846.1 hypothetical protein D3250_06940 [Nesterenkonia natronophila]
MAEDKGRLTGFYGRAKDEQWHQQKHENHRRWRRRTVGLGLAVAAAVIVAAFVIYDYPRESGLTDTLGLTCGEYVQIGDPQSVESPMNQWEVHRQEVAAADEVDGEGFLAAAEIVAAKFEAEPLMGQFYEAITQRESSAAVVGEDLVIGHHQAFWSATDRVSVFSVTAEAITWTAELDHPVHDQDLAGDDRPRVLYGVGTTDDLVVLQTPTYRGDTDLVIADKNSAQGSKCVRLEGAVDTVEVLTAQPDPVRAWSQTINLNARKTSANGYLIYHGGQQDSPHHEVSLVDVATEEVQPDPGVSLGSHTAKGEIEIPREAHEAAAEELQHLAPVGENHYLLTWEAGYLLFAAD